MTESKDKPSVTERLGVWLDTAVSVLSPKRGMQRKAARRIAKLAERRSRPRDSTFEGAISGDRLRGDKWIYERLSIDSDMQDSLDTMRLRSRQLFKNDSIGGAVDSMVTQVVGCGFTPQSRIRQTRGLITKAQTDTYQVACEELFNEWAKRADKSRKRSFWQIVRLAMRNWLVDGEAFVVMSDVGDADSPIPLALEVVDAERVETPPKEASNPRVRMGIERDAQGKVIAYHIRTTHPYDSLEVKWDYERVEADRVCHVFEPMFAGQSRGLPWLYRVSNRARDIDYLDEASVIAAQVQACQAVFIEQQTDAGLSPGYQVALGAASTVTSDGQRRNEMEPGAFIYGDPGQKAVNLAPSQPSGLIYGPFMEWSHRRIAAGLNYPFEFLCKNWSGVSFAGGRLVLQEAKVDWGGRQKILNDLLLEQVWNRAIDEFNIVGDEDEVPWDSRTFEQNKRAFMRHEWTPPKWPYSITPKEEIEASIAKIQANLGTAMDEIAAAGGDAFDIWDRRAQEIEYQREKKILPPEPAPAQSQDADEDEDETAVEREQRKETEAVA